MKTTTTAHYRHFFRKIGGGTFKHSWKVFGLYFTISNCRVKRRTTCGYSRTGYEGEKLYRIKMKQYRQNDGHCPHCGRAIAFDSAQLHHVLPYARFSDLINDERNVLMLCRDCHKEIHCNPFLNARLMEEKAAELSIDLDERYNRQ